MRGKKVLVLTVGCISLVCSLTYSTCNLYYRELDVSNEIINHYKPQIYAL